MEKRVSLADVARATGVTVPTVSRALRDLGTIPSATRRRIKKVAHTLGYRPNPLLAALASKHFSSQVGGTPLAFIHVPQKDSIQEGIAQSNIKAASEYAIRLGYRLEVFRIDDFKSGAQATRILFSRGVQGIVLPQHFEAGMLPGMDWPRFSIVGLGEKRMKTSDAPQLALARAAVDHFEVVLRTWDETLKRGYRRIGFVIFKLSPDSMDDRLRWGAILTCLQDLPPRSRLPVFFLGPNFLQGRDSDELGSWVCRYRPDAVIGFNDGIRSLLLDKGFRIPQEIGFAALHKELGSPFVPDWVGKGPEAGMKEMRFESILAALELLDQQIRHHQLGLPRQPRILMIPSEWIEGETLPPKPSSK
jgi:DNA-binding LacI/PurR family transcriptional regulator